MSGKYTKKGRPNGGGRLLVGALSAVLLVLLAVAVWLGGYDPQISVQSTPPYSSSATSTASQSQSTVSTRPPTVPTEPPIVKLTSATISNVGDMLMHMPLVNSAKVDGGYDFSGCFAYMEDYFTRADYAVANLETTLAGADRGYSGYPGFNSPDVLVEDLQNAGFDMLLTANNHSYDTGSAGFHRTQEVIGNYGMNHLGTVSSQEDTLWQVRDINGIHIGMVCYTYQTGNLNGVSLNGIPMTQADSKLIGVFSESHLDVFYEEMQANIAAMKENGAEAIVLYIHWGYEYQLTESQTQNRIAQKMCDLGVDVIVGGHAHVVQPMELLTSSEDPDHKTVCLYSMGNAISNQRKEAMGAGYPQNTEDGVMFTFTFAKYSDGTVILESAQLLPFWVNHFYNSATGKYVYQMLPLDKQIEDWKTQFALTEEGLADCDASYARTMKVVGQGLEQVQTYLEALVAETEENLGIS